MLQRCPSVSFVTRAGASALVRVICPGNSSIDRPPCDTSSRELDACRKQRFRNLSSPLTALQPDFVIDVQNTASMLFRLERQGVDVGDRWTEIADKAVERIGDCLSAFTLPHWLMALAATGREQDARLMLEGMRIRAQGPQSNASVVGEIALPIAQAVLAHGRGDYSAALDLMRPLVDRTQLMGGSHAQHDVLRQLFLDCAMQAGRADDVRLVLGLAAARYPTPLERRVVYAEAARLYVAAGS